MIEKDLGEAIGPYIKSIPSWSGYQDVLVYFYPKHNLYKFDDDYTCYPYERMNWILIKQFKCKDGDLYNYFIKEIRKQKLLKLNI